MKLDNLIKNEYADMQGHNLKDISVQETEGLSQIILLYKKIPDILEKVVNSFDSFFLADFYDEILKEMNKTNPSYTPRDITSFSILFDTLQSEEKKPFYGFFIASLVNFHYNKTLNDITDNSSEKQISPPSYLLIFPENVILDFIGYKNRADVTMYGNAGSNFGNEMIEGTLRLHGKVNYVGPIVHGGEIHVESAKSISTSQMDGRFFVNGEEIIEKKRKEIVRTKK